MLSLVARYHLIGDLWYLIGVAWVINDFSPLNAVEMFKVQTRRNFRINKFI